MTLEKRKEGNTLYLTLNGRLDTATCTIIEPEINDALTDDITDVVIDCTNLEYLASSGLRILLSLHKRMAEKGSLTLNNVADYVMEIFNMTGFSDVLNINQENQESQENQEPEA